MNRGMSVMAVCMASAMLAAGLALAQEEAKVAPSSPQPAKTAAAAPEPVMVSTPAAAAPARPIEAVAKEVLQVHQDSIVWVSAVCKMGQQNQPIQLTGFVVDESGIVLCSLRVLNPSILAASISGSTQAELENVKIMLPDGKEIPADLILTDEELDIAVIKVKADAPEAKDMKWKAVDFKDSTDVGITDKVIELSRMNAVGNRQPYLRVVSIVGMTVKPRKYYISDGANLSCPVFGPNGKVVGMATLRSCPGITAMQLQHGLVILPAANVIKVINQGLKAQPAATAPAAAPAPEAAPAADGEAPKPAVQ